jgi:fermentation-respiration switch protein FrsA (DUF1100 family)
VDCPILIVHGTKDEVVPYSSGKKLYESLVNKNVTFCTIPNGKHNNLGDDYKDYWEVLSGFLSKS